MSTITSKDGAEIYCGDWGKSWVVTSLRAWPLDFDVQHGEMTFDEKLRGISCFAHFPRESCGDALGFACLVDMTDRVKAQAKLTQVQAELAHAARVLMLGELTASIGHEINQSLGAILLNASTALRWLGRKKPNLDELRALAARTVADVRRAADIVQRIQTMAVLAETKKVRIGLNDVVEDSVTLLRPELTQNKVDMTLQLAPALPDIMGDGVQLQQVFVNLMMNAMHAMSDRPSRRLTVRTTLSQPDLLTASVEDTGPGIVAENMDRLFGSFFTTKKGGMGLGLSICRSIIEAHGGHIEADNLPNSGARFSFTLPVRSS